MNKNILAISIILLFIISSFTPITFGYSERTSITTSNEPKELIDTNNKYNDYNISIYPEYVAREKYPEQFSKTEKNNKNKEIECLKDDYINTIQKNVIEKTTQSLDGPMDSAWPMHGHDNRHTGLSPYSTAGNLGEEKWWFYHDVLFVEGSPVVDKNGVIYYGSHDGHLYAIKSNGTFKWRVWISGNVESSPAIDENGVLYVGTVLDYPSEYLYAICTINGTKKWKYKTEGDIFSSPVIGKDGTIYFGSEDDNIYALYPNGTLKWIYDTGNPVLSSPAIGDDGIIYCGSNKGYIYALYPNGTIKWKYKTDSWVHGIPTIGDDGTIYCGSDDGYMYALYPNNGTMKWRCLIGAVWGSPALDKEGNLYVGVWEKKFYCIKPDGTIKWSRDICERVWGQSAVVSDDGTIYFGTSEFEGNNGGPFHALNPDGTVKYILDHTRMFWASPAIGDDGTIFICTRKHRREGMGLHSTGYLRAIGELNPDAPLEPTIDGPEEIKLYEKYDFKFKTTSPLDNDVYYWIEWGDLSIVEWIGPYASGETVTLSHKWDWMSSPPWTIRVKAKDTDNLWGPWGELTVTMQNITPDKPTINGPIHGKKLTEYTYTANTTDPNDDNISYFFKWGDSTNSGWTEFVPSGTSVSRSHRWFIRGTYTVSVKAKDDYGAESEWASLTVTIPRNKAMSNSFFYNLLERFPFLRGLYNRFFE